jgi:hypothetical protein
MQSGISGPVLDRDGGRRTADAGICFLDDESQLSQSGLCTGM